MRPPSKKSPPKKTSRKKSRPSVGSLQVRSLISRLRRALYPAAALLWAAALFVAAGTVFPATGGIFDVGAITLGSLIGVYLPDVGASDSRAYRLFGRYGEDLLAASREGAPATSDTHSVKGLIGLLLAGAGLIFAGPIGYGTFAALVGSYVLHLALDALTNHHELSVNPPKRRSDRPKPVAQEEASKAQKPPARPSSMPAAPGGRATRPKTGLLARVARPPRKT